MKVQLILFPQNFKGAEVPMNEPPMEHIVNNSLRMTGPSKYINNWQPCGQALVQKAIDSAWAVGGGFYPFPVNAWLGYGKNSNGLGFNYNGPNPGFYELSYAQGGLMQKMAGMTPGNLYTFEMEVPDNNGTTCCTNGDSGPQFKLYHTTNNVINNVYTLSAGAGIKTQQFTAVSSQDSIVIDWCANGTCTPNQPSWTLDYSGKFRNVYVKNQTTTNNYADFVQNGQVICDLYDDEDIPMTFSIDDFKNVAEKVQSYSKAFMLPGTKRNNVIFDNIFEITKHSAINSPTSFNPYSKTRAILKQDGFLLFEGYLRLIKIQRKDEEVSYSVNLYSEVVALADILKNRIFSDINFDELLHAYDKQSIKLSTYSTAGGGLPLLNPLSTTSPAYDPVLGVNNTNVLKYPFVDWTHKYALGGTTGNSSTPGTPELLSLDDTFRPWIQCKYLLDRIFDATPFSYKSNFLEGTEFGKLFMDFNWESRDIESGRMAFTYTGGTIYLSTGGWDPMQFDEIDLPSQAGYDNTNHRFTATQDGTTYEFEGDFIWYQMSSPQNGNEWRWTHYDAGGTVIATSGWTGFWGNAVCCAWLVGTHINPVQMTLNAGDYVEWRWYNTAGASYITALSGQDSWMTVRVGAIIQGTNVLAQSLRGKLNQWDFIKGFLTMFNLVTLPNESDPNLIEIEPYADVFINNTSSGTTSDLTLASRSIAHDWTEKMDETEMNLIPLTELNKTTKFVWELDKDDYFFNKYKSSTGHPYGTGIYSASMFNILEGEKEISGKPFAATLSKPLMTAYPELVVPSIYQYEPSDGTSSGFDNVPRICYNNGRVVMSSTYYMPEQNGLSSENQSAYLQFSHLSDVPCNGTTDNDYLWMEQDYAVNQLGFTTPRNLFNRFWLPYYQELYHPDTKTMTMKIKLTPADIELFKLYDTVFLKQRQFRVNKIDYKPHDLSNVEFILIP